MEELRPALNLAVAKAKGQFISWLSHDDLLYSGQRYNGKLIILRSRQTLEAVLFMAIIRFFRMT